jgi:quinol monooxygenase YgiN
MPSATINPGTSPVTLINVFTVEPGKQGELVQILHGEGDEASTFVSANIHKSLDGTRVVNYAQWRSRDDFEAMVKNPEVAPHMKAAGPIAKFEPHFYAVAAVHTVRPRSCIRAALAQALDIEDPDHKFTIW